MYEFLKMLLPVAEQIGSIKDIRMYDSNPVFGSEITISGTDSNNRSFDLRITFEENKANPED